MPRIEAIRSGAAPAPNEFEQKQMQNEMEQCAMKCLADAKGGLDALETRLAGYAKKIEADIPN